MSDAPRDVVTLSSGREVYAHRGIIGIDPCARDVYYGYDGVIFRNETGDDGPAALTAAELVDLAERMIERWRAFRDDHKGRISQDRTSIPSPEDGDSRK